MFFSKRKTSLFAFSLLFNIFYSQFFSNKVLGEINNSSNIKSLYTNSSPNQKFIKDINSYRLGPGDQVYIKFAGLPEFSRNYFIGPEGYLILPEIRSINVNKLTLEELNNLLLKKYSEFLIDPDIYSIITLYRPVRVYVIGEVARPGFYTLRGTLNNSLVVEQNTLTEESESIINSQFPQIIDPLKTNSDTLFPTIFDAIKAAQGVTPYSDLSNVELLRNIGKLGSEKVKANVNFLSLITEGNQSQNIRVLDGDTVVVLKSKNVLKEQISKILKTNLSPDVLKVYVTGNVVSPGMIKLPAGSGLNQALAQAGGKKILSGSVEFLRFSNEYNIDKRKFSYDLKAKLNTYKNPILMNGDIVNVRKSIIGNASEGISEISRPVVGIYSLYNLFYD